MRTPTLWFYRILMGLALLLGFLGVFLPLLPTTPFLLIAVWASSRCSPRLHQWLLTHPRFGGYIQDWAARRAIPRRAKVIASVMMVLSWVLLWWQSMSMLIVSIVAIMMIAVMAYIAMPIISRHGVMPSRRIRYTVFDDNPCAEK